MDIIAVIIAMIVPIGVAIWTVRSSAKDTAKQITALEESTTKQIESIKELARIQIQISTIQIEKELSEARNRWRQTSEKKFNAHDIYHQMTGAPINEYTTMITERREKEKNLSLEQDFYSKQVSRLDGYLKRMNAIKSELNKE